MQITKIKNLYHLQNKEKIQNIQTTNLINKKQSPQKHTSIPLQTWQAYTINSIQKINFTGTDKNNVVPVYFLIGPPLAGKGTLSAKIQNEYKIPHISVGEILRKEKKEGTELGKIADYYMSQGLLMPSELVMELVKERIKKPDCKKGFIFDGFPRKLAEYEQIFKLFKENEKSSNIKYQFHIIHITADEDVLKRRMEARKLIENRSDDNLEALKKRLEEYRKDTLPIVEEYKKRGMLTTFKTNNADKSDIPIQETYQEIINTINNN